MKTSTMVKVGFLTIVAATAELLIILIISLVLLKSPSSVLDAIYNNQHALVVCVFMFATIVALANDVAASSGTISVFGVSINFTRLDFRYDDLNQTKPSNNSEVYYAYVAFLLLTAISLFFVLYGILVRKITN